MEKKSLSENLFIEFKMDEEERGYLISFIVKDIQKITTLENGIKTLRNFLLKELKIMRKFEIIFIKKKIFTKKIYKTLEFICVFSFFKAHKSLCWKCFICKKFQN